ncbi:MAG: ISAs1 family transposase, partial [Robiginitomaculum sp.]|nr:ISAs1 family transposase [Robiginitomaculum sp.]
MQEAVADKSNEITAIPALLKKLNITGCIITIDAMGTQKQIARQISKQKGDYLLALKGKQRELHDDVRTFFDAGVKNCHAYTQTNGGHGRIEERTCHISEVPWLCERHPDW